MYYLERRAETPPASRQGKNRGSIFQYKTTAIGLIQPFQQPERVVGFFNFYRQQYPVSWDVLRDIATQFHNWVVNRSQKWGAPILEAPQSRRDEFIKPYFRKAKANQVVAIVKGHEPAAS